MRRILFIFLNLLLALAINQSVYGQQSTNPPPSASTRCFEDQPSNTAMTGLKNIHAGETVTLDLAAGDIVIFASHSDGSVLAFSEIIEMEVIPSGTFYNVHEREGTQRMEVTDLLTVGSNQITLTEANPLQTYWFVAFTPCDDEAEAIASATEAGFLGINNAASVIKNIADVIASLELPESGTDTALAGATATPQKIAQLSTATAMPTEVATVTAVATAAATPTATEQAVAMVAPAAPTNKSSAHNTHEAETEALLLAIHTLHETILGVVRMVQMSLILAALSIALFFGLRRREQILGTLQSLMRSKRVQRAVAHVQRLITSAYASLLVQSRRSVQQIRHSERLNYTVERAQQYITSTRISLLAQSRRWMQQIKRS